VRNYRLSVAIVLGTILMAFFFVGYPNTEAQASKKITPKEAHAALIDVDSAGHERTGMGWWVLIRAAKTAPIERLEDGSCEIGGWHCNLAEGRFEGAVYYPKALRHKNNEWYGVFERTTKGKWRAKVTHSRSDG
jgi:hypothetical protein